MEHGVGVVLLIGHLHILTGISCYRLFPRLTFLLEGVLLEVVEEVVHLHEAVADVVHSIHLSHHVSFVLVNRLIERVIRILRLTLRFGISRHLV